MSQLPTVERVSLGVDVLNYVLPQGVPRNSFILLAGEGGSGKSVLVLHIAKSFLERGEPVVYITLDDDPVTIVSQFTSFGIDVAKHVDEGRLLIVDGFSFRIRGRKEKLHEAVVEEVDPQQPDNVLYTLIKLLDDHGVKSRGIVILDSLNEFLSYQDPIKVVEFIKNIRANISKTRNVIVIAVLHTSTEELKKLALSIEHLVDGVMITETVVQHPVAGEIPLALRQLLVRKMKGVSHRVNWTLFTIDREGVRPVIVRIGDTS